MFGSLRAAVKVSRSVAIACCLLLPVSSGCVAPQPTDVRAALSKAGRNRSDLRRVLRHYRNEGDAQKLRAAQFLIANMAGHGYTIAALFDADRNEIAFDALEHANFAEALAALDALEEEHGELDFKRKHFIEDLHTITAEYLIENTDLAFQAWREKPWARDLSFEAFLEHVLPYRSSNEPINAWRQACLDRYADLPTKLEDPNDPREAAKWIERDVNGWVRFDEVFYLHPTDEGFDEMNERGMGRCEDITNMQMYATRANAIAAASDYTPFWADRDNNHAWQVILDAEGKGKARLLSRAAKVYRKTFSIQQDSLAAQKRDDEQVPRWLSGRNYVDVTTQYVETTDVTIPLLNVPPEGARFAYICVFNGGEWKAIHWGEIEGDATTFTNMGRNIAYLPAYYVDKELHPAAPPFILTGEGEVRTLVTDGGSQVTLVSTITIPKIADADTRTDKPKVVVEQGKTYELSVWKDGWETLSEQTAGAEPLVFESLPSGGLFWLVEEDSRRLERIFTIEDGKQVWW